MKSDIIDRVLILEKIVAEEGSCDWADHKICALCPLGKMVREGTNQRMSCVEALNVYGLNKEQADAVYKRAALDKLANLMIETTLMKEEDGSE